jgi:hypothetical protein
MNSWAWRNPEYMLFDSGFDRVKKIFAGKQVRLLDFIQLGKNLLHTVKA